MQNKAFLCFLPVALLAACARPAGETNEVREVILTFYQAADSQDIGTLDELLHPDFRLVVTRPDMEPQVLDKDEFIALMMTNLIGGKPRRIDQISTHVSGDRAVSHVKLEGPFANFEAMQTFVRNGSRWSMLHSLTQYDPKS